jgi:alpha-L-fucosidase
MNKADIPAQWQWFNDARFGMFIHWGAYALYGRGEQVLNRERIDHGEYAARACSWNPQFYDPRVWAGVALRAGMKYGVLGARHHDGYCLWDTKYTDYSSAAQSPRRDFVGEFVEAFRAADLRIGLYYSLIDLRIPAWYDGPAGDPEGWEVIKTYVYNQVRELLTNYGRIDVMWFDGLWPRCAADLESPKLIAMIRELQPDILINDRLEWPQYSWFWQMQGHPGIPREQQIGDFGTPEQGIYASTEHMWESCQTSTRRLWGFTAGERWHDTAALLELLVECAGREGNLLLNVGPDADGQLPPEYMERVSAIGRWLEVHGEAIYGSEMGDVTEFITHGWQTVSGNNLYLILRTYDGEPSFRMIGLATPVQRATLLTTGQELTFAQNGEELVLRGLPPLQPTDLFPVIKLTCTAKPAGGFWAKNRVWGEDASGFREWAARRGTSVWADGKPRVA